MNIAVIGKGGHSRVVQEMILEKADNKIAGYLDDRYIYISFEKSQFYGPVSTADKIKKLYKSEIDTKNEFSVNVFLKNH